MRFLRYIENGREGLAVVVGDEARGLCVDDATYPGELTTLVGLGTRGLTRAADQLRQGTAIDLKTVDYLPPLGPTTRIICMGINYLEHVKEAGYEVPKYPTFFTRYQSSIVGHGTKLIRPKVSVQFDYEGELVIVIGKRGRYIPADKALEHVAGYSICNDGSIRDFQFATTQWTLGKNFDGTGSIGPYFVTAEDLPAGGSGLSLQTRLNGQVVQNSRTDNLIFNAAAIVAYLSEGITLEPGDVIPTGTPPGVGWGRKPQLFMKAGDRCEVEIEGVGTLSNTIADENR